MQTEFDPAGESEADRPSLPVDAERFVWARRPLVCLDYSESWAEDPHVDVPEGLKDGQRMDFEFGDPLPRDLVEATGHREFIVMLDAGGAVVEGIDDEGAQAQALERYRDGAE